jgi:hypothetical protein
MNSFALGCTLFDPSLGQRLCVMVPNASKDFNDTRELINEAIKYLEDKCACINHVLKSRERIRDLEINLARINSDLDYLEKEDEEIVNYSGSSSNEFGVDDSSNQTQKLLHYKNKMNILANLKLHFKSLAEDKESLFEHTTQVIGSSKQASSKANNLNLDALNRKFNFESRQKLEKTFGDLTIKFTDIEVKIN